jgi:geranylgeranyl pyrophosphate synthase
VINRTLDVYESGEKIGKDAAYYRKTLNYLGIAYQVVDDKVVIVDMDKLIQNLKRYQETGTLLRDIKSGKGTPEELVVMRQKLAEINERYDQQWKTNEEVIKAAKEKEPTET